MATSFPKNLPELYKIEPLDGPNNKCWSQKLLLCFEQLEIDYVLSSEHLDKDNTSQFIDTESSLSTPSAPKTSVIPLDEAAKKNWKRTINWLEAAC